MIKPIGLLEVYKLIHNVFLAYIYETLPGIQRCSNFIQYFPTHTYTQIGAYFTFPYLNILRKIIIVFRSGKILKQMQLFNLLFVFSLCLTCYYYCYKH